MCRKLCVFVSFVLLMVLAGDATAKIDPASVTDGHVYLLDNITGSTVPDDSANSNDGAIVGDPQVVDGLGSKALMFDGVDDGVDIPDSQYINVTGGPFPNRTVLAVFSCADVDKSTKQTVFEEGGRTRGLTIYVHEGLVYVGGWNRAEYNWNGAWLSAPITSNQWVAVALVIRDAGEAVEDDKFEMWMDGRLIETAPGGQIHNHGNDNAIGYTNQNNVFHDDDGSGDGFYFEGIVDEVWILNQALTEVDLSAWQGKPWPYAFSPDPADGAMHEDTWITLNWKLGAFAVSHDVYMGDNFDDVNDATQDSDVFRGNQTEDFYVAGFPGNAYPEGLVPGTTYYWRIDEVNDTDPNSPWKGAVWSFSIPPLTAYNPTPAEGAKFIDIDNPTLTWTPGFKAKLHYVYFGEDPDAVANAAGAFPQADAIFAAGTLEREKTYYWRVDEFDGFTTHKGDVWSFTTAREGGGVKGQYYDGMNFETLVVTRVDPQINFNWGNPGGPDPGVGDDQFSARWTGQVEAAFTEPYTFYTNSDDGVRLWISGQQLVNNWTNHAATENKGTIDLVAGNTYSLQMEYYEDGGGAVAELRWSSPRTPKDLVPQAALSLPVKAGTPKPGNGANDISLTPVLAWNPGDHAASHEVYFGTDADAVANATKASPEFKATKALGDESYTPGKLDLFTSYYWRVDEVNNTNPDSPWVGNVWSFTTGDFLLVDDFESYTDDDANNEAIWQSWIDGFGVPANGSQVGYLLPPYAEQTIVHGGSQSMPLLYTNEAGVTNSEAALTLTAPRDWTDEGVGVLSLWMRGASGNAADPVYVAISNAAGAPAVVANTDPAAAALTTWSEWRIPLQTFADQGINLTNVDKIAIGVGSQSGMATVGGTGTIYVDDIRLYRP